MRFLLSATALVSSLSSLQSSSYAFALGPRLIQIPDIHGDFELMQQALALITPPLQAGDRLVFTGDFVDRGPDPISCYKLSQSLAERADLKGNVTRLIGNHEWVNLRGLGPRDTFAQYVSKEDLGSFGGWNKRMESWTKEGEVGRLIREGFDVIALEEAGEKIDPRGRTLFVHAGIEASTMKRYGTVEAMRAEGKKSLLDDELDTGLLSEILQTRHLAQGAEMAVCNEVEDILKTAKGERIVVGHTPTTLVGGKQGAPVVRCGGRLILMDVAMSRWMGGGMAAILVLETEEEGRLKRIYVKHGRGEETQVEIPEKLNNYEGMGYKTESGLKEL